MLTAKHLLRLLLIFSLCLQVSSSAFHSSAVYADSAAEPSPALENSSSSQSSLEPQPTSQDDPSAAVAISRSLSAALKPATLIESPGPSARVRLSASQEILQTGQTAEIAVQISKAGAKSIAGLSAQITLPPELIVVEQDEQLAWILPDVPPNQAFRQTVQVGLADGLTEASVVDVVVSVDLGTNQERRTLQMGIFPIPDDSAAQTRRGNAALLGASSVSTEESSSENSFVEAIQGHQGTVLKGDGGGLLLMSPAGAMPHGTEIRVRTLDTLASKTLSTGGVQVSSGSASARTGAAADGEATVEKPEVEKPEVEKPEVEQGEEMAKPRVPSHSPSTQFFFPIQMGDSTETWASHSSTSTTTTASTASGTVSDKTPIARQGIAQQGVIDSNQLSGLSRPVDTNQRPAIWNTLPKGERPIFHHWEFIAENEGAEIEYFDEPLLMVYDVRWLIDQGVSPYYLGVYSRQNPDDDWEFIESRYIPEREVLVADVHHFSEQIVSIDTDVKGDILPSVSGFSSDLFTGAASVNYPIEVPVGPHGMTPNLSLSYSSSTVDDFVYTNSSSSSDWDAQVGPLGIGWALGGLGYVARVNRNVYDNGIDPAWDDEFAMVAGGTSIKLRRSFEGGPFVVTPQTFTKVASNLQTLANDEETLGRVYDSGTWTLTSGDGSIHTFGTTADPRQGSPNASPQMIVQADSKAWKVNRWNLTESQDTLGNYISYTYVSDTREMTPDDPLSTVDDGPHEKCPGGTDFYKDLWYHRAVRPDTIQWGGNKNTGAGHTMQVVFGYTEDRQDLRIQSRPAVPDIDDKKDWELAHCIQYIYTKHRLSSISVEVKIDGAFKPIRKYQLAHGYTPQKEDFIKHLRLDSIKHYGYDNSGNETADPLHTYSFSYIDLAPPPPQDDPDAGPHSPVYMETADNGWGGKTTFVYETSLTQRFKYSKSNPNRVVNDPYDSSGYEDYRQTVSYAKMEDGLGNFHWTKYTYQNARERYGKDGLDFLGHDLVTSSIYGRNQSINAGNIVRYSTHAFHQMDGDDDGDDDGNAQNGDGNPDPLVGREFETQIMQPPSTLAGGSCGGRQTDENGYCIMQRVNTEWEALTGSGTSYSSTTDYHARPRWVRQKSVETVLEDGSSFNKTTYGYNASGQKENGTAYQFGNVTDIEERDESGLLRNSQIEFRVNTSQHIVNTPVRTTVTDGSGCASESRTIYDNPNNSYTASPTKGLVAKSAMRLTGGCGSGAIGGNYDSAWAITQFDHDTYGNVTKETRYGPNSSKNLVVETQYDGIYHLFPIRRWNGRAAAFEETAEYYGVNRSYNSQGAHWGAPAQHCGVNDVCSRIWYDSFGRPTARWDLTTANASWPDNDSSAETKWLYASKGKDNQTANVIVEWNAPRCDGNFTRRLYNGWGQLIQQQTPTQNRFINAAGENCSNGDSGQRAVIDYQYDSLGNQTRASVPRSVNGHGYGNDTLVSANWGNGYSESAFDVLGRPMWGKAPNGERTEYTYDGRETQVVGKGSGVPDKMLRWTETDGDGNLAKVYSGEPNGNSWAKVATVTLNHDALGNLKTINNAMGATASMNYDLAGRKLNMNDPDLGYWSYEYDRLGNLEKQTDACGNQTTMVYDNTRGWLSDKLFTNGSNGQCNTTALTANKVTYGYGSSSGDRGQLTSVAYSDSSYSKSLAYNAKGLLQQETISFAGGPQPFVMEYTYDSYNRPKTTEYPDGDVVTIESYNSLGLPKKLTSSKIGVLVDNASYDEGGMLLNMVFPAGGNVRRDHSYYGWAGGNGNGNRRLQSIKISSNGGSSGDLLALSYSYDSFGNVATLNENYQSGGATGFDFDYDLQNRLTKAFDNTSIGGNDGQNYAYDDSGRITNFEGENRTSSYNGTAPVHAPKVAGAYVYDANGNMTTRNDQTLFWDVENRLKRVTNTNGTLDEEYWYDPDGIRVKKRDNLSGEVTYYVSPLFEMTTVENVTNIDPARNQRFANSANDLAYGGWYANWLSQ